MISMNTYLKSLLLGLSIAATIPSMSNAAESITLVDFVKEHPVGLSVIISLWIWAESHIRTSGSPKEEYKWSDFPKDIKEAISYGILDKAFYKKLLFILKKYGFGVAVKLNKEKDKIETTLDNGVIKTRFIPETVLKQKPFGIYGMFDAYVLMHLKKFGTDYVPAIATIYMLLSNPVLSFEKAAEKVTK